jgi:hypothetical protein
MLGLGLLTVKVSAQDSSAPYKVLDTTQLMGNGGIDYLYADNDERRVYVPRGGSPEQAQSDGQGHLYMDLEDQDSIAVVDMKTMKVTATYSLQGKGGGPGGLGLDAKNHILFAMCHNPATCVVLNANDGTILAALPIGNGTDGGGFNPNTMEAFSSQRDGTLTIIKENSPTSFAVEQTVKTKAGCKTCSLDSKDNRIIVVCTERLPQASGAAPETNATAGGRRRGGRGGPGNLDVLWVGR